MIEISLQCLQGCGIFGLEPSTIDKLFQLMSFYGSFLKKFQCQWENWETFQKFFARVLGFLIQSLPNEIWRYFYENIKPSRAHESRKINLHFSFTTRQACWIAKIIVVEELPSHSELIYFIFIFIFTKNVTSFFAWIHANIVKKRPALNFMAYPICKISWWQQKMCILATFFYYCKSISSSSHSKCSSKWVYLYAGEPVLYITNIAACLAGAINYSYICTSQSFYTADELESRKSSS